MKNISFYFWAVLLISVSIDAYWSPTPVSELTKKSTEIVLGKVIELKSNLKTRRVVVTLSMVQIIKGVHKKDKISFDAPFSLIGDVIIHPLPKTPSSYKVGENCLVFLQETKKGLKMTMDTDGKYLLDKEMKNYRFEFLSGDKWKPVEDLIKQIK